mgnify:CR=1 FL=1
MKEISIEELKLLQLNMLTYIKKVCEKNNLKYYLCGGTLLGAIRHKGYIPWDDDIDIFMPIDDYKRFLKLNHKVEGYTALNPYECNDYYYTFSKLVDNRTKLVELGWPEVDKMGVYIDIFPLFALPDNETERDEYISKLRSLNEKHYRYFWSVWNYSENRIKMIAKSILKFPGYIINKKRKTKENILKLMDKYDFKRSENVGFVLSAYDPKKEVTRKEVYEKTIQVEFEGELFSAPVGYDEYLSNLYGEYMKLPPIEKRKTHHNFKAYWKN